MSAREQGQEGVLMGTQPSVGCQSLGRRKERPYGGIAQKGELKPEKDENIHGGIGRRSSAGYPPELGWEDTHTRDGIAAELEERLHIYWLINQ